MNKKIYFLIMMATIVISTIFPCPFGLETGMTYQDVENSCNEVGRKSDEYFQIIPKKRNTSFDKYYVKISENEGLYYIRAEGSLFSSTAYERETKNQFEVLETDLTSKYGEPQKVCKDGGFTETDYSLVWTKEMLNENFNDIYEIRLSSINSLYAGSVVILEYYLSNYEKVKQQEIAVL